jgi:argonaute-like protein implicated in RNA metabolism and viral defense
MINDIRRLLEAISVDALDTLTKYSKSTPDFMLDRLISNIEDRGFHVDYKSDNDSYYLTLSNKNGRIKEITISREDLVKNEIDINKLIG